MPNVQQLALIHGNIVPGKNQYIYQYNDVTVLNNLCKYVNELFEKTSERCKCCKYVSYVTMYSKNIVA